MKIAVVNGPNMNLLGVREPSLYGMRTLADIERELVERFPTVEFAFYQSNHEGCLIDYLQQTDAEAVVLNAAGYTHTSVALRDTVAAIGKTVVEVHITDIREREPFRRQSYLTDVCQKSIIGHGTDGYREAVEWIINN